MSATEPTVAQPIVEARQVTKIYPGNRRKGHADVLAVDAVDLVVGAGELVVLLGPSGCGKTTLLRCIAGLERPATGRIRVGGQVVFDAERGTYLPPERRRIGMMFQSYALWPHMTVFDNVAYPLASPGTSPDGRTPGREAIRARVTDQLARLGVAGLEHRFPGELSGGQQQRVALARALVAAPPVILFDEPLSNVDAKVRRRLRAELRELKAQTRFAGLYVTHDQEEAMELADALAVMEAGVIRQRATGRDVYTRPASLYVADFVGAINRWPGRVEAVDGPHARVASPLGRFVVADRPPEARPATDGWLVIRPERVGIAPPDADAGPADGGPADGSAADTAVAASADAVETAVHPGLVVDAIDFGPRLEYRVRVGDHELMVWRSDDATDTFRPRTGDPVRITLPGDALRWLAA